MNWLKIFLSESITDDSLLSLMNKGLLNDLLMAIQIIVLCNVVLALTGLVVYLIGVFRLCREHRQKPVQREQSNSSKYKTEVCEQGV